jgi:hypothetical protein
MARSLWGDGGVNWVSDRKLGSTVMIRISTSVNDGPHIRRWSHNIIIIYNMKYGDRGSKVVNVLRCTGSNSDGVMEVFIDINPSDRTMALGSTQPLTEMRPGVFPGGKCGRCLGRTTLPPSCAVVEKSGNLNFLEPSGPLQACNGTAL